MLSLLLAFAGGIYLSKFVRPVWFSADLHRPLDEIAEELVSDSHFEQSINRTLEGARNYYQKYAQKLDVQQKAKILAVLDENEENLRKEMKTKLKQLLIQSLSREELIEAKDFYKTHTGQQLNKLINSPKEHLIYSLAFEWLSKETNRIKESTPASNVTPPAVPAKQSK
jgi:hypothetical protein